MNHDPKPYRLELAVEDSRSLVLVGMEFHAST